MEKSINLKNNADDIDYTFTLYLKKKKIIRI